MHAVRVACAQARTSAQEDLQYRSNFWVYLVTAFVEISISMVSLWLVYSHVDEINGWRRDDLLVVLGSYFALGAIVLGVVHLSASELATQVLQGTFDFRLLKPVDAQLVAIVQKVSPWRMIDLVLGMALVAWGLVHGGHRPGAAGIVAGVAMFMVAIVILVSFWLLVSSLVFWTVQGEGILYAMDEMFVNLRWPIGIFPPGLRFVLTAVYPAGFAITVPAEALTGRLTLAGAGTGVVIAAAFLLLSRLAWRRALRRYEGASS